MEKEKINISCSDLIKKSAKAICYFRKKRKQFLVTENMIKGNESAERKIISELKEMRGTFVFDNVLLHYTFDEIQKTKNKITLVEHKNIEEDSVVEDWYLNYSLLQVAFYHSLLILNPSKEYFTALFFRKQGFNTNYLKLETEKIQSILFIGTEKYLIKPISPEIIVDFYFNKAIASMEYESAIEWDLNWKFKEYDNLKKTFSVKKLKDALL